MVFAALLGLQQPAAPEFTRLALFRDRAPSCISLAEAADYFIGLGAEQATRAMSGYQGGHYERLGWVCRMVFTPKDAHRPLRQPMFGTLPLPYRSMLLPAWPNMPLVEQNGVWFVLASGYSLAGKAEPISSYVAYCRANGEFRTQPISVPAPEQAARAVTALEQSRRWNQLRWSYKSGSESYTFSSWAVLDFLRSQAK